MTAQTRRSFSQSNLEVRHQGPLGEMLVEALRVPQESGYTSTHAFHPYPGRFHPDLARTILSAETTPDDNVLDPFMGGGTTLVEAMTLGRSSVGSDLNPVAVMVARERVRYRSEAQAGRVILKAREIADEVGSLRKVRRPPRVAHPHIHYLAPQYQPHLIAEMLQWYRLMEEVHDSSVRETLRAVFSAGCVKFANRQSDSSGRSAPTAYPKGVVSRFIMDKCTELTTAQVMLGKRFGLDTPKRPVIREDDARLLPSIGWGEFDLILTSPPYPGTYDYLDHHRLRMAWLDMRQDAIRDGEIGARREESSGTWSTDNRDVLVAMARVLKPGGKLFIVIGDWIEDGHGVDGASQLVRLASDKGWQLISQASVRRDAHSHKERRAYRRAGKWEHLLQLTRIGV